MILPVLAVAQVALEALEPLSIASGAVDPLFDTVLVTDANGLPTIPGSALAGVLRTAYQARLFLEPS